MMFFSALFITKNEGETQKIYEGKKYYSKINPEEEEKSFVCFKKKNENHKQNGEKNETQEVIKR